MPSVIPGKLARTFKTPVASARADRKMARGFASFVVELPAIFLTGLALQVPQIGRNRHRTEEDRSSKTPETLLVLLTGSIGPKILTQSISMAMSCNHALVFASLIPTLPLSISARDPAIPWFPDGYLASMLLLLMSELGIVT